MLGFPFTFVHGTVTLSGPSGSVEQARELVGDAGYRILHELPDPERGLMGEPGQAYLRVDSSSADALAQLLEPVGWRVRLASDDKEPR